MNVARIFAAGMVLAGCTHDIESYKPLDVQAARELDILFVIDDSTDRARYDQMAQQIDVLQAQLASVDGQLPSLHVGVVTTDLGTSSTDDDAPLRPTVMGCFGAGKEAKLQRFTSSITDGYLADERDGSGSADTNRHCKQPVPTQPRAGNYSECHQRITNNEQAYNDQPLQLGISQTSESSFRAHAQ